MHINTLVRFCLFSMDSKNNGRRRKFIPSQTTKLSKLSIHKKTKDTESVEEIIPSLFDSPFLLKSCRYIDISSTESKCSKETSKAKPLHSNELSADSQNFPSGNCVTETIEISHFEDRADTEEQIRTSEVLEKENILCNSTDENLLNTNSTIKKSVDVLCVSEQNQTPLLPNKNKSEVLQIFECVTFDTPNKELNLCHLGQHKSDGELELKKEEETVENETADFNLSSNDINISACPLCWKKIEKKTTLFSHMKICASSHNVSTRQLLNALDLQNKQAAERKAIGLPAVPQLAPARRNSSTRKSSNNVKDPNLQLALALSVSMKEAEELEIQKETDVLLEAGLEDEAMEKQKSLLERFGFTSSKSPVLESVGTKSNIGSKKFRGIDPVLLTRSQQERERLITEKVAIILMDEDCSSSLKQYTCNTVLTLNSKLLKKLQDVKKTHWQISYASEEVERSEYYVKSLQSIIPVCSIASGSKLKQLTEIPCREKTPEKDERSSMCCDNSVNDGKSSETQLFEFVDDLNKYSEPKKSKKLESVSSTYNFQDTDKLSSMSSLLQKNSDLYRKELLIDWERMINNETMRDVTIYTKNEEKICAHKLVFYARCSQILSDITQYNETGGGIIFWNCVTYDAANAFLSYLYCGDVKNIVNLQEHLLDIKYLAVKYNITELINIFKTTSLGGDIDTSEQSFEDQKQNIKETSSTSNCIVPSEDTCETQTRFHRCSENELKLETSLIHDACEDSLTVPKSPDLFGDQKIFDVDSDDDENCRKSNNSAAEGKSDLDFLASMLCKSTPTTVSPETKTEAENFDVSISPGASKRLTSCESDNFSLNCTPDKEVKCHAKRYFEDDNSCNEYKSDFKKVCIEGELGLDSSNIIEAGSCIDLVDLTQSSSDENEDGKNCSGENGDSGTKQVTIPKFSWKYVDRENIEDGSPDKNFNEKEELSKNEPVISTKCNSPDKIMDYKTEDATSKANISASEDFNAELDLFGYDEYDHFYNNDLSYRSPIQSPENSLQDTEIVSENLVSSTASDEIKMIELSQKVTRAHETINDSISLKESRHEEIFKSPCVSNTKQKIQSESPNLLAALLDDSFSENLANSSLLKQSTSSQCDTVITEKVFSPGVQNGSEKMNKQIDVSTNSEHQNNSTPDNNKLNYSPNVTPMPDYSTMKTPVLKKELNKYGLKALKRRQAKLILRHIYNELHPLVPIENVADKLSAPLIRDEESSTSPGIHSEAILAAPKSPVKRNLMNMDVAGGMETESNTLSDSESSESSNSENEHNMGDDKIFVEADELASQGEGSLGYDLPHLCQEFIQNNPEFYQKILLYEPIWLEELYTNLKCLIPKLKLNSLMDYLDEQCITFRTSSQRQRRKNRSPSKKKRTLTKGGRTSKSKKNDNLNNKCS